MVQTAEGIKLIAAETARIKKHLEEITSEEWALESPCEGWTVGDVIGHLGWAAEFFADSISRGREGITTAPDGLPEINSTLFPPLKYLGSSPAWRRTISWTLMQI